MVLHYNSFQILSVDLIHLMWILPFLSSVNWLSWHWIFLRCSVISSMCYFTLDLAFMGFLDTFPGLCKFQYRGRSRFGSIHFLHRSQLWACLYECLGLGFPHRLARMSSSTALATNSNCSVVSQLPSAAWSKTSVKKQGLVGEIHG